MGILKMIHETELGFEILSDKLLIFFGKSSATTDSLKKAYPQFEFARLKQIHSDAVVETKDTGLDLQVLADAHWSYKKDLALCVITADCVPLFIFDSKQGLIAGIHAGWRGVANQITMKTVNALLEKGSQLEDLKVFVGPHIQAANFEVALDVRDLILASLGPLSPDEKKFFYQATSKENKFFVDLHKAVRHQLLTLGLKESSLHFLEMDTFSNSAFHSHRRDKEKAGRQVSFICQTS